MNNIFKKIAQAACEEEIAMENAALELAPPELGRNGGCHVVAQILKDIFPHYQIVGLVRENGLASHVGCAWEGKFVDIDGIREPPETVVDCEPVSEDNPVYRGFFMQRRFVSAAIKKLEPFIRSQLASYSIAKATKETSYHNQRSPSVFFRP